MTSIVSTVIDTSKMKPNTNTCCAVSEEKCSICLEIIDTGELNGGKINYLKLKCGHSYHKYCIETWYKQNKSCPYCRDKIKFTLIEHFSSISNNIFKLSKKSRKTIKMNDTTICFIDNLKIQNPCAWVDDERYYPLYKIILNGEETHISYYLRNVIVNSSKLNINSYIVEDMNGVKYYDTDESLSSFMDKNKFKKTFNWIYDFMFTIKNLYGMNYEALYNTIIFDYIFETYSHFNLKYSTSLFNSLIISTIYSIKTFINNCKLFNKNTQIEYSNLITLDVIKSYKSNNSGNKDIDKFVEFQSQLTSKKYTIIDNKYL